MALKQDGDVGIGNDNPSFKLDVSGTGRFTGTLTTAAITTTGITSTGNISGSATSTGSFGHLETNGVGAININLNDLQTNDISTALNIKHKSDGSQSGGIGVGIDFFGENSDVFYKYAQIAAKSENYGQKKAGIIFSTGNNNRGIEFIQGAAGSTPASGQTKKASILWNEGNSNFNFKNFRNDANQSYANMGFFTGGTNSSDPALRLNINYQGSIGFSDSGGSINTDPNQISYGTTGQVLTSKGMNAPPAWEAAPGIASVANDTSPDLGGNLNLLGYAITNSISTATGSGTSYDLRIEKSTSDYVGFRMKNTANFPTHGMGSPYANFPHRLVLSLIHI